MVIRPSFGCEYMLVLITYDVNTTDTDGRRRLRKIAKMCVNYGQRVQNSVFECALDPSQYRRLQHDLISLMDINKDSLRFYNLGNKSSTRAEHIGVKSSYDPDGLLLI